MGRYAKHEGVHSGEVCYHTPHTSMSSVGGDARGGRILSIRECIMGKYAIIPGPNICKVLEGMKDGEVCLACGSV